MRGVVQATTVEFLPVAADVQNVVSGPIGAPISPIAADGRRTFRLDGLTAEVKTTLATAYRNGAAADVAVGRQVRVNGSLQGTQFVADEVQFMDNPASPPRLDIGGIAGSVQPTSVVVNGQTVQLTGSTTYTLDGIATTSASLRNGLPVELIAIRENGTVTALSVAIKSSASVTTSICGRVTGRTTPNSTSIMVGSQRVSVAGSPSVLPAGRTLSGALMYALVGTPSRFLPEGLLRDLRHAGLDRLMPVVSAQDPEILRVVDVRGLIEREILAFSPRDAGGGDPVSVAGRELRAITWWGGVLGALAGGVQSALALWRP